MAARRAALVAVVVAVGVGVNCAATSSHHAGPVNLAARFDRAASVLRGFPVLRDGCFFPVGVFVVAELAGQVVAAQGAGGVFRR